MLAELPDVMRCGPKGPQGTHWEHREHVALTELRASEGPQKGSSGGSQMGPFGDPFWTPLGGVRRAAELCEVPDVERCGPRGPQATHWEHSEHTPPRSAEAISRVPNRVPGRPPE